MSVALRLGSIAVGCMLAACASREPGVRLRDVRPPPPPAGIPETWSFEDASVLPEHRERALATCRWLLGVAPATANSKQWIRARDYALDWVEANTDPAVLIVNPVLVPPLTDRKFFYSAYMRMAYQCGKAEWVLANIRPGSGITALDIRGELAAVNAMLRMYDAIRYWDMATVAPKLERYRRKMTQGKLEAYLLKKIAKAKK